MAILFRLYKNESILIANFTNTHYNKAITATRVIFFQNVNLLYFTIEKKNEASQTQYSKFRLGLQIGGALSGSANFPTSSLCWGHERL